MTEYEKFQAFTQHTCKPIIAITGVEATKLQLLITDCDVLSDDVLENCNIMTEKNKHRFSQIFLAFLKIYLVLTPWACEMLIKCDRISCLDCSYYTGRAARWRGNIFDL